MAQLKFGAAGVTSREIDLSGPVAQEPVGIPAGIIGTSVKGPAFVPITVGTISDWYAKFGSTDGKKFGPLAVTEWMRNARAVTYLRVLGVGDGKTRTSNGSVSTAGFIVGENLPNSASEGNLVANPYANVNGAPGRTYFLGCFMSESAGSSVFSSAGLQGLGGVNPNLTASAPIVRGVLFAPSGVLLRLSGANASAKPSTSLVAADSTAQGSQYGKVVLSQNGASKQEFVMLLNGHNELNPAYPNVISASFDMTANNYFGRVFNTDPLKIQATGHYLYAHWDVHPSQAVVTGTGLVHTLSGSGAGGQGAEVAAFLTTGSAARNTATSTAPNYESFSDRFREARGPWVFSQKFGGSPQNLFRVHALDSGAGVSTLYKISIENIVPSTDLADKFCAFDLVVRSFTDRDTDQVPLERFSGLSLDPQSDRYIAKIVGDLHVFYDFDRAEVSQNIVVEGTYPNRSNYIRVEIDPAVENLAVDPEALPVGFRGAYHLVTSGTAPLAIASASNLSQPSSIHNAVTPPVPFRSSIANGSGQKLSVEPRYYWGVQFEHAESITTPNGSNLANDSIRAFAKYFPDFADGEQGFVVGDNEGEVDTDANGVVDADRFCRNAFSLENVKVVTSSLTGLADPTLWKNATYVRAGNIVADSATNTRAVTADDFTQANRRFLKFSFFVQGGFDGVNVFDDDEAQLKDAAVAADMTWTTRGLVSGPNVKTYMKAVDIMKGTSNVDVQLLAIPGIRNSTVTNYAIDAVQERFDALYIMDIEQLDSDLENVESDSQLPSVQATTDQLLARSIDSSFAAAYFPDVILQDPNTKTNVIVPPSVAVLGALALNDAIGHPWFAPAGVTRGALSTTLEARVQLSKTNMDTLYDANINPLVAFPGNATSGLNAKGGVTVWGQKTLQMGASALDRVNVRRLLIEVRRQVRDIGQTIIFEPNRESTLAKFSAAVTPRLQRIQALSGLERFKVIIDSSTTTQNDIENNTIRGKIFLQPTKAVEYVSIDFVVSNTLTQV